VRNPDQPANTLLGIARSKQSTTRVRSPRSRGFFRCGVRSYEEAITRRTPPTSNLPQLSRSFFILCVCLTTESATWRLLNLSADFCDVEFGEAEMPAFATAMGGYR
jgi:hypothetical protein